jgi:hypothetical protein
LVQPVAKASERTKRSEYGHRCWALRRELLYRHSVENPPLHLQPVCCGHPPPPTRIQHFPGYRTLNLSPLRHCRHSAVPYSHLRSTIAVTNKLRNVQANPIVPPRPPCLRLPPNHRIASAPASALFDSTRILAAGALAETVLSTGHPVGVVI